MMNLDALDAGLIECWRTKYEQERSAAAELRHANHALREEAQEYRRENARLRAQLEAAWRQRDWYQAQHADDERDSCCCPQCVERRAQERNEAIRAEAYRLNASADPAEIRRWVKRGMVVVRRVQKKYPSKETKE